MHTVYLNGIRYRITHVQDSGYIVTVTTDDGSVVERRLVRVTFDNPVSNVRQALTGALNDMRRDIGMPPVTEPADAIDAQAARDAARYRD